MNKISSSWGVYFRPFLLARGRKSLLQILNESLEYKKHNNMRPKDYFFLALYMKYVKNDVTEYIPNAFVYHSTS